MTNKINTVPYHLAQVLTAAKAAGVCVESLAKTASDAGFSGWILFQPQRWNKAQYGLWAMYVANRNFEESIIESEFHPDSELGQAAAKLATLFQS